MDRRASGLTHAVLRPAAAPHLPRHRPSAAPHRSNPPSPADSLQIASFFSTLLVPESICRMWMDFEETKKARLPAGLLKFVFDTTTMWRRDARSGVAIVTAQHAALGGPIPAIQALPAPPVGGCTLTQRHFASPGHEPRLCRRAGDGPPSRRRQDPIGRYAARWTCHCRVPGIRRQSSIANPLTGA